MTTRRLLIAGAVAGPFFIASSLVQAVTRAGFDPARHQARRALGAVVRRRVRHRAPAPPQTHPAELTHRRTA